MTNRSGPGQISMGVTEVAEKTTAARTASMS
jgi:hypothetical protein